MQGSQVDFESTSRDVSVVGETMVRWQSKLQFARPKLWMVALSTLFIACSISPEKKSSEPVQRLRLATTTSTRDSGLFDILLPHFENTNSCRVDVVAVGTGAALRLGEAGDADVLVVHAREAELAFMRSEHGIRHEEFMYNYFVLVGPPSDPAGVSGSDPVDAFKMLANEKHTFLSRGDDSGTHKRELAIWSKLGGRPDWSNYLEVGQGMGATLMMADEKQAYVLSDMGTYLKLQTKLDLRPVSANSDILRNPYAVIQVNGEKSPLINADLADRFVEYLLSGPAQQTIANYQVAGQPLFFPTRLSENGIADIRSTGE